MNELLIVDRIEDELLRIVSHGGKPTIVFMYVDTTTDENMKIVPFLNIYGSLVFDEVNFDAAFVKAVDNSDSGYIEDILEEIDSSSFEINLSAFYPNWPDEIETGDHKVINIIKSVIDKNQNKFNLVQKLYFNHVDNFDFVKIID